MGADVSVARKIWIRVTDGSLMLERPSDADEHDNLYHHDNVVRELVEALERVVILGRVAGTSDKPFMKTALTDCGDIARAALAKIAQEG